MRFALSLAVFFAVTLLSIGNAVADHKDAEKALKAGNYGKAISHLQPLADKGDPKALAQLGQLYASGQGVATNHKKAVELFRKSAELGDADGAFGLGMAYNNGDAVLQDKPLAARWFKQAADGGHCRASYVLAGMLLRGDGIPKSQEDGFTLMNQARRCNDMDAALFLRNQLDSAGDQIRVRYEGGFGDNPETAVRIMGPNGKSEGVAAQRKLIEQLYPGWQNYKQSMLPIGNKIFDAFELTATNGNRDIVYFDVTNWYK